MIKSYVPEIFEEDFTSGEQIYVFFRSKGCGPCREIEPQVLDFADRFDKLIYIVESDEAETLRQKWNIKLHPSMAEAQDGKIQYLAEGTRKIQELM
jgi:thiol-disulfide isomerase/thioredoxin